MLMHIVWGTFDVQVHNLTLSARYALKWSATLFENTPTCHRTSFDKTRAVFGVANNVEPHAWQPPVHYRAVPLSVEFLIDMFRLSSSSCPDFLPHNYCDKHNAMY